MKKILLIFLFFISCINSYSESILHIVLNDGEKVMIPFSEEIDLQNQQNGFLSVVTATDCSEIYLNDIKSFNIDKNITTVIPVLRESQDYSIFTIDGRLLSKGSGVIDTSLLERGILYIVKRGGLTYKYIFK